MSEGGANDSEYLDRLMRRGSFEALWPLFAKAPKPAKEMTESFSALVHLRPLMKERGECRVIHVGDGAHARTAALFALKTKAHNIAVDPLINEQLVSDWRTRFGIERFEWRKAELATVASELNALEPMPVFVTFVHAHIDVDEVLSQLVWDAAFSLACCVPGKQLTRAHTPHATGEDHRVLSPDRRYEVLVNLLRCNGYGASNPVCIQRPQSHQSQGPDAERCDATGGGGALLGKSRKSKEPQRK
jgi:hypothetical protein